MKAQTKKTKNVEYIDSVITCTCGAVYNVKSTKNEYHIDICSQCHPAYTGKSDTIKHVGKVDKFNKKYGFTSK